MYKANTDASFTSQCSCPHLLSENTLTNIYGYMLDSLHALITANFNEFYVLNIAKLGIFFLFASIEYCNAFSFLYYYPRKTNHFSFYEILWTVYCTSCCCFALEHPLVMIKDYNYLLFGASKTPTHQLE